MRQNPGTEDSKIATEEMQNLSYEIPPRTLFPSGIPPCVGSVGVLETDRERTIRGAIRGVSYLSGGHRVGVARKDFSGTCQWRRGNQAISPRHGPGLRDLHRIPVWV